MYEIGSHLYPILRQVGEDHIEIGTVCGINIKPIDRPNNIGLFLHIRVPNGDQYDFIWKLYDNLELIDDIYVQKERIDVKFNDIKALSRNCCSWIGKDKNKELKKGLKKSDSLTVHRNIYPLIPAIFNKCGVKEWVEVIGSNVQISTIPRNKEDTYRPIPLPYIRRIDDPNFRIMVPHYFDIQTQDQKFIDYVDDIYFMYKR